MATLKKIMKRVQILNKNLILLTNPDTCFKTTIHRETYTNGRVVQCVVGRNLLQEEMSPAGRIQDCVGRDGFRI